MKVVFPVIIVVAIAAVGGYFYFSKSSEAPASEILSEAIKDVTGSAESQKSMYPDDYVLKTPEIPAGFQLEPITDEARALGFSSNPGFISNQELYQDLYEDIDISKIESVYAVVYVKPESPQQELGIFAVQYKLAEGLDSEILKISSVEDRVYLRDGRVLVVVWSDASAYANEMKQISTLVEARLNLNKI